MKKMTASVVIAIALFSLPGFVAGILGQEITKPKTNAGFEQLKSLAGAWDGTNTEGKPVHVAYEVASNGSALLERLHPTTESEMVTMYSADGDRVAVTHYCNMGNQPQMQTEPLSGTPQKYAFHFVRATNLASPGAGHMVQLVVAMQDHDHFLQEWTWAENGKTKIEVFRFTRKS